MTHEEMEKTMQFVLAQQAQFVVDIQQMKEVQTGFQKQLGQLTEATLTVVGLLGKVAEAQVKTESKLAETDARLHALIDRQAAADDRQAATDERINVLIKNQMETDGRVRALADLVERYIRRNGRGE